MQAKSHKAKTPRKPMEKNTANKSKPSVSPSSKSKSMSSGTKFLPSQKQNSLSSMHKSSNPPVNETLDLIEEDDSSISDINQITERNNNDIQQSLKMALQFAQFHRKENQAFKIRLKEMEKWEIRSRELQLQIKELVKTNKSLQDEKNICQEKYKKLKAKYKELKKIQENLQTNKTQKTNVNLTPCRAHKDQDILTNPYLPHPILLQPQLQLQIQPSQPSPQIFHQNSQQPQPQQYSQQQSQQHSQHLAQSPAPQPSSQYQTNTITFNNQISDVQHQLQSKNKTIQTLCQQICQYQQNSQNVLKLVNVLEQRVQQLSMDNNLLKGIHKQRQESQYSQKWEKTSQELKQEKKISVFRDERWDIDNRNIKRQRGEKKYHY